MSNPNPLIHSIQTLDSFHNHHDAYQLLCKAATLVYPVMKEKGWQVQQLKEFLPPNPGLLGMNLNQGQLIYIRLRPSSHRSTSFFSLFDIIGTLLHELVHISIGPHTREFYKCLDSVWFRTQTYIAQGYTGRGFFSQGQTLLSFSSTSTTIQRLSSVSQLSKKDRNLPSQAAAQAASQRAANQNQQMCGLSVQQGWTCLNCDSFTTQPKLACSMCLTLKPSRFSSKK